MSWLWWLLVMYGVLIVVGIALGGGWGFVAVAAPILPFFPLIRWVWRPSDWLVERTLKALRPQFRAAQPAIVKTYTRGDWPPTTVVQVYLACALERDRPALDVQLPEWSRMIREELLRRQAPAEIARNLTLTSASKEYIDRAGGLYNYLH